MTSHPAPLPRAPLAPLTPLPRAARVLLVWAAASLISLIILRAGAADTPATPWADAAPSYLEHLRFWDAGWYERVLTEGYPSVLPVDASGAVTQNAWAFMPLLPSLATAPMALGLGFYAAAAVVAVTASAGAAVVLDRWLAPRVGSSASLWAVALVWTCPVAPVLQVPYAESLGLVLLAATLLAVERGRWRVGAVLVLLTSLARPLGVPLAGALLATWVWRELGARALLPAWAITLLPPDGAAVTVEVRTAPAARPDAAPVPGPGGRGADGGDPGETSLAPRTHSLSHPARRPEEPARAGGKGTPAASVRDRRRLLALGLWACGAALAWPAVAWLVTGRADAYTATETAWRGGSLAPFVPWAQRAEYFGGAHAGWVLLAGVLALVVLGVSSRRLRGLGALAWWWCVAYTVYLLAFFDPTTSLLRLLLPLAPAAWALAGAVTSARVRWALVAAGVVGQVLWVAWVWDLGTISISWVP